MRAAKLIQQSTRICSFILLFFSASILYSQQIAFPGAEGYGKYATGGRGGKVIEVTNLNSSGTGSLGAAISASGIRTVVFRVSGTITGNFGISNDNITIAGQTAPGDGICIKGNLSISADNVIIRYIRTRWDPALGANDAIGGRYYKNIIIDHVSASWSTDETFTFYHNENTTVQWCLIAQPCPKTPDAHRFGGIWGNNYGTWHHNLIAHSDSRNPRWASGCGYNDSRNNVLYNWGYNSCYGGEAHQSGDRRNPPIEHSTINMIANYYKAGPATGPKSRIAEPSTRNGEADAGKWWLSDNVVEGYPAVTADNWMGFANSASYFRLSEPWDAMPINQQNAEIAYQLILPDVGCSLPNRDSVDADIIDDVLNGTAKYGDKGIIDSPSDVGGWPVLNSLPAPPDFDHDGMPNDWELANGLDSTNAADKDSVGSDGYTMLEKYLNSIIEPPAILFYPVNISAKLTDLTTVKFTWEEYTDDETGFRIEKAEGDSGSFAIVKEVGANVTSYVDSSLKELTLYRYKVSAFNDSLESGYSTTAKITTLSTTSLPVAVSNLSPDNRSVNVDTTIELSWEASVNATSYDINFGAYPPSFISNQVGTTFKPDNLAKGDRYYWRIDAKNANGITEGPVWYFTTAAETGIESEGENIPGEFKLSQNYPNPFNPSTTIKYQLKSSGKVNLTIYDITGCKVKTLVNQQQTVGEYSVTFNASNLVSGLYIYKLKAGPFEQSRKMLLLK